MSDEWGVGKLKDAKPFDSTTVGQGDGAKQVELIFGEHPHSRGDNSIYARFPDGTIEPFDGHRLLHEIKFRDYNYLKDSELSGSEVRKGGICEIWINGFKCDEFFYRAVEEALLEARSRLAKIKDCSIQIWDKYQREKLIGRKVYWHDQPAKVKMLTSDGCVVMEPDYPDGSGFNKTAWMQEDGVDLEDGYEGGTVKDSIYDSCIFWWRK